MPLATRETLLKAANHCRCSLHPSQRVCPAAPRASQWGSSRAVPATGAARPRRRSTRPALAGARCAQLAIAGALDPGPPGPLNRPFGRGPRAPLRRRWRRGNTLRALPCRTACALREARRLWRCWRVTACGWTSAHKGYVCSVLATAGAAVEGATTDFERLLRSRIPQSTHAVTTEAHASPAARRPRAGARSEVVRGGGGVAAITDHHLLLRYFRRRLSTARYFLRYQRRSDAPRCVFQPHSTGEQLARGIGWTSGERDDGSPAACHRRRRQWTRHEAHKRGYTGATQPAA